MKIVTTHLFSIINKKKSNWTYFISTSHHSIIFIFALNTLQTHFIDHYHNIL